MMHAHPTRGSAKRPWSAEPTKDAAFLGEKVPVTASLADIQGRWRIPHMLE